MSSARRREDGRPIRRGFALPVVLLLLAALSVVALQLVDRSRTDLATARAYAAEAALRHAADSGVAHFIVSYPMQENPLAPPPVTLAVGPALVSVVAENEAGKVDLNSGASQILAGILEQAGVESARAGEIVNAIYSFQEEAGGQVLHSPDELLRLPGVDHALLERIRPFVTVYTGAFGVDPRLAPREVLLAVPRVTEEVADRIIAARKAGDAMPDEALRSRRWLRSRSVSTFTIRATAALDDGASFVREAVVVLDDPEAPITLGWRRAYSPAAAAGTDGR